MNEENLYYKGTLKQCKNCAFFTGYFFSLSRCKKHPNWLTSDAFSDCLTDKWIPNQKMYDKKDN